jgi:predicted ester cyclase
MDFDVDRLLRLWNEPADEADFAQAYADPVVLNGVPTSCAQLAAMARGLHAAVSEQEREIVDVSEGPGKVTVAFVVRGRHIGPLPTRLGVVPPTGQPVQMTVIDIFTLVDGLIAEVRAVSDEFGMLIRLGAVTLSGGAQG